MKKLLSIIVLGLLLSESAYSKENVIVLDCLDQSRNDKIEIQIFLKEKEVFNGYDVFELVELEQTFLKAKSFDKEYVIDRFTGYMVEFSIRNKQRVQASKVEWGCTKIERMF